MWPKAGRALLLSAVVFWWGGYVIPHLFSAAFPALLPPSSPALGMLNASKEGTIANTFSALTLAGVTLLLIAATVASSRRSAGRIAVAGWAGLAVTTAALAFEELAEFKRSSAVPVVEYAERLALPWPVLVSPLVIVFLLAMSVFVRKGLVDSVSSAPLMLGVGCWVFALVQEAVDPWLFYGRVPLIGYVLEETLEYSGTLLIGFSAAITVRDCYPISHRMFGGQWRRILFGSALAVLMLGGFALAFLFRAPLVEALAPYTRAGAFRIDLQRQESVVQEFRMPATPVRGIRLSLANCGLERGTKTIGVRVTDARKTGRVRSEGSVEVPIGDCPRWKDVELLPPVTAAQGESLRMQIVADTEPGAVLGVGATKTDRNEDGRLWVNGALTWPDQNIEFVAYSAPELTRSKLLAMWRVFTSDWRWPVLFADMAIGMTLLIFVPVQLITAALPGRRLSLSSRLC